MKKKLLFGLLAFLGVALCFVACDDDDEEADRYYVRYSVGGTPDDDFYVCYLDEKGKEHIVQGKQPDGKVEVVIGPVKSGFKAQLAASLNDGKDAPQYSQIEVSYDGRPFVQKVYLVQGTYIFYTITDKDR